MKRKFNLTKPLLSQWFKMYNSLYFKNALPEWDLKIKENSSSYFGKCFYEQKYIVLSTYYDRDERGFQQTLLHEMIHEWQYVKKLELGHGNAFKQKAKEINKAGGWNIKRCSDDDCKPVKKNVPMRRHYEKGDDKFTTIILWEDKNNETCFSFPTKCAMDRLVEHLNKNTDYFRNYRIYTIPNDDNVQLFRHSSSLRFYRYKTYGKDIENALSKKVNKVI